MLICRTQGREVAVARIVKQGREGQGRKTEAEGRTATGARLGRGRHWRNTGCGGRSAALNTHDEDWKLDKHNWWRDSRKMAGRCMRNLYTSGTGSGCREKGSDVGADGSLVWRCWRRHSGRGCRARNAQHAARATTLRRGTHQLCRCWRRRHCLACRMLTPRFTTPCRWQRAAVGLPGRHRGTKGSIGEARGCHERGPSTAGEAASACARAMSSGATRACRNSGWHRLAGRNPLQGQTRRLAAHLPRTPHLSAPASCGASCGRGWQCCGRP